MSGFFAGASTQYLQNSSPSLSSTGYPITVGAWVNLTAVSTVVRTVWSLSDTGTTNNFLSLGMSSSEQLQVNAAAGGTTNSAAATTAIIPPNWYFVIGRFITSANRRVAVLRSDGQIQVQHAASTTARAPTGMDAAAIGCLPTSAGATLPWDGMIGELWYADIDIQADGLQLEENLLRHIAYNGPFSVPHIAKGIVEYKSLRSDPIGTETDEVYFRDRVPIWVNTNGVTLGPHPNLLYEGVERQSIRPYSLRPLWAGMAAGGTDVSESRTGTSIGATVVDGRVAVLVETATSSIGASVDTGRVAIQDAKTGSSIGVTVVNGIVNAVVTAERTGTSVGVSVVDGRIAVQDAKRSDVTGITVVTGASTFVTAPISVNVIGTSVGLSVVDGRIAAEDAKKSDVTGLSIVTGVSTFITAGAAQPRAGSSVGASVVEARIAWMAEIMGQIQAQTIVDGIATFTDESGATTDVRFNPLIASVGKLMNR